MKTFFLDEDVFEEYSLNVFLEAEKVKKELEKDSTKDGKKVKVDPKVAKEKGKKVLDLIKSIYTMKEDELLKTSTISRLIKVTVRASLIYGVFLINPLAGVITYYTDRYLKQKVSAEQRTKLLKVYTDKLEFVKHQLEKVEDDKERYKLIKIRSTLEANIKKIKVYKSEEKDEQHE